MAIPRIIHYCWFGEAELPEDVKKCIESWKKYCPDYEIIRWDETNYDYNKYQFTREAYEQKKWAFVSDVARLDIVYNYGGIYLDTDVELVRPLDELLCECAYMGFEKGKAVATGLGFGGEKGNRLIKKNLDVYKTMSFVKENGELNLIPCPQITTAVLEQNGLVREDKIQYLDKMKIYPSDYFSPMILSDGSAELTNNTISIHRFAGTWTTDKEKRAVQRRRMVYTKFGKNGLRVYDGIVLLRTKGWKAFWNRCIEILNAEKNTRT